MLLCQKTNKKNFWKRELKVIKLWICVARKSTAENQKEVESSVNNSIIINVISVSWSNV